MKTNSTFNSSKSKIELLPEHIIDQIKAGEVIERPASLLKEVIENSVDAGSNRIDIEIRDNGLELISIVDNGNGINYEELPLAFCRHATSKIRKFEDIYSLHSYGFRGEALASIASISRVSCSSTKNNGKGGKYLIHGGEEIEYSPITSSKSGTSLFIKDLFYNTPARLKFVKSKTSEKNALRRVINAFIINNPTIDFSVKWDQEEKLFFPKVEENQKLKRIHQVFYKGKKSKDQILTHSNEYDGYKVELFISTSSTKSNSTREQYLFTNGRLFNDKAIHQIITKNLIDLWGLHQFGHYCLFINAPTNEIDVNAHPSKTYIKFLKSDVIYSLTKTVAKSLNEKYKLEDPSNNSPTFNSDASQSTAPEEMGSKLINGNCISLSDDLSVIIKDEEQFLCSHQHILKEILDIFMQEEDFSTTPVLISEHVLVKNIDKLDYLKNIGFDFEKLEESFYMLNSFPTFLSDLPFTEIARVYLSEDKATKIQDVSSLIKLSSKNVSRFIMGKNFNNYENLKKIDHQLIAHIFDE